MEDKTLRPEDYVEPRCLLCDEPYGVVNETKPVPQQRIIEKMDEYMSRRDYAGAERHLLFWLEEARLGNDKRGELLIRNELVGHYRKTADRDKAFANAREALRLIHELDFDGTISSGTTYVNIATAYNAFDENERSAEMFEKAQKVYESSENTDKSLLGGLYNNMGLTYASLGRYDDAMGSYRKALDVMGRVPGGNLEQAITYLNMADTISADKGPEAGESDISDCLDRAYDLLKNKGEGNSDGYYAFVCEKCAPSFSFYGYFMAASELKKRSETLYAGD